MDDETLSAWIEDTARRLTTRRVARSDSTEVATIAEHLRVVLSVREWLEAGAAVDWAAVLHQIRTPAIRIGPRRLRQGGRVFAKRFGRTPQTNPGSLPLSLAK